VLTFKRGLLAAVGHDLCLGLEAFRIELEGGVVEAHFELSSLRVLGAMRGGVLASGEPGQGDRKSILDTVRREILHVDRHPRAMVRATLRAHGARTELRGELTLCGATRPLAIDVPLPSDGTELTVRSELRPSQWGIQPYSALAGTLKLQDRVQVVLTLGVDSALLAAPATTSARWAASAPAVT
jgi:hypothetical protein